MFKFNFLGIDWDFTFIKITLLVILIASYGVLVPVALIFSGIYGLFENYYITIICAFLGCLYYASWHSMDRKITKVWHNR